MKKVICLSVIGILMFACSALFADSNMRCYDPTGLVCPTQDCSNMGVANPDDIPRPTTGISCDEGIGFAANASKQSGSDPNQCVSTPRYTCDPVEKQFPCKTTYYNINVSTFPLNCPPNPTCSKTVMNTGCKTSSGPVPSGGS